MKKNIVFLTFIIALLANIFLFFTHYQRKHFVEIRDGKFELNGKIYFPIVINYMTSVQADGENYWIRPYTGYYDKAEYYYLTEDSSLKQLMADFQYLKESGFNAIRLGTDIKRNSVNGSLAVYAQKLPARDTLFLLSSDGDYYKYFKAMHKLFSVARDAGLKVIFVYSVFPEKPETENHLKKLALHFRDESAIFAYDLFNEPLYFDSLERTKLEVKNITLNWKNIMKKYAPYHLTTIGLEGIREVFEWDPNILEVDFISYHPYEYEPEQVRNEIYWYGKYTLKPWIIGETAIPADNDSVPYEVQRKFARKSIKQAVNCGALGYSWWQYKDVEWYKFHANYMGILSRTGTTLTRDGLLVEGKPKSVIEEFKSINIEKNMDSCYCLPNYYNYSLHKAYKLTGNLVDEKNTPIEGGVIIAWNQWWSSSYHTITKADGTFELLSDFPLYHWRASATMYSCEHAPVIPDSAKLDVSGIRSIDIGVIRVNRLESK